MTGAPSISISHAGFHVFDMDRMVDFFTTVYGFHVTDRGHIDGRGEVTFLCGDPRDHHQLVLYEGRTATDEVVHHNHVSFRVASLDRLRRIHAALQAYPGVTRIGPICHGNAWSVYAYDPEGNRTEAFVDTPWHVAQPCGVPLDLSLDDEAIMAFTEDLIKDDPTRKPFAQWREEFAEKIEGRS